MTLPKFIGTTIWMACGAVLGSFLGNRWGAFGYILGLGMGFFGAFFLVSFFGFSSSLVAFCSFASASGASSPSASSSVFSLVSFETLRFKILMLRFLASAIIRARF